ncbi:MAG: alpha/beta hydrolase [Verrucomicrobiae bacterium]|nr:alpha/beta hydrolase [Verrucomicrobiae bacterium]
MKFSRYFLLPLATLIVQPMFAADEKKPAAASAKPRALDYAGQRAEKLEPDQMIVYKRIGDRELKLHVFLPDGWKASDKRPCFHIIHGGGWQGMSPLRMYPFAADFAKRYGMVAVAPEYRLYKPDKSVTVFDCVEDARSSVRYVRSHAAELGIDPDRLVVSGASAGGHLAAATAMFDTVNAEGDDLSVSCEPNALVLFFPVIDTSGEGYGQAKIGDRWEELSPAHHVRKGIPPTITFHGTGDTTTPFAGAKSFHEQMLAAGNRSELIVTEGGVHGYLMRKEEPYTEAVEKAAAFLTEIGLCDGKTN